jgi:hypothetical protein
MIAGKVLCLQGKWRGLPGYVPLVKAEGGEWRNIDGDACDAVGCGFRSVDGGAQGRHWQGRMQ